MFYYYLKMFMNKIKVYKVLKPSLLNCLFNKNFTLKLEQTNLIDLNSEGKITKPKQDLKKSYIHPKDFPKLKLDKLYSYDTLQLAESIKFTELKPSNINYLITLLSVIRKKNDLKVYDFPEILKAIEYIHSNSDQIKPSYLINFIYSLSKIHKMNQEKPSIDNPKLIFETIRQISLKLDKVDIRGMSNLLFALHKLQMNNTALYNFTNFFQEMEVEVIKRIEIYKKSLTPQDLSNIILSYCKVQTGSEEFFRILQEIVIHMKDLVTSHDMAIILYSYANNPTCTDKVLVTLEKEILANIRKYKVQEVCNILRAYNKRKILSEDMKKAVIEVFIEKHELLNSMDISYFYSILADENEKLFLKYAHKCMSMLYRSFNPSDIGVVFEKVDVLQRCNLDLYKLFQNRVLNLMKTKDFKGYEMKKIYLAVKDIPFEGKYYTFREKMEKYLEDIKYY